MAGQLRYVHAREARRLWRSSFRQLRSGMLCIGKHGEFWWVMVRQGHARQLRRGKLWFVNLWYSVV